MNHGLFQLGQIHGVAVFTACGHVGDLAATFPIAYGNGPVTRFPDGSGILRIGPCLGIPARDTACPVSRRAHTQGHAAFRRGIGLFADSHCIFFCFRIIADGHGRRFCRRLVAHGYSILAIGLHFTAGSNGIAGRLIKNDGIELIEIICFLIVVFQAAVSIFIRLGGIGGDFRLGHCLAGRGIFFRIGMDILGCGRCLVIRVPEHLGHLRRLAIAVRIPGRIVLAGGFVSIRIGIIGGRGVFHSSLVTDGRGSIPFRMAIIAQGSGSFQFATTGLGRTFKLMSLSFPINKFRIGGTVNGLSIPCAIISNCVRICPNRRIIASGIIFPFRLHILTNSQVSISIISSSGLITEVHCVGIHATIQGAAEGATHQEGRDECLFQMHRTGGAFRVLSVIQCDFRNHHVCIACVAPDDFEYSVHEFTPVSANHPRQLPAWIAHKKINPAPECSLSQRILWNTMQPSDIQVRGIVPA